MIHDESKVMAQIVMQASARARLDDAMRLLRQAGLTKSEVDFIEWMITAIKQAMAPPSPSPCG